MEEKKETDKKESEKKVLQQTSFYRFVTIMPPFIDFCDSGTDSMVDSGGCVF